MKVILATFIMVFSLTAFANDKLEESTCLSPESVQTMQQSQLKDGKTAQNVLCCCPTFNGGQCCKNVSFCGGFIPGCMCSGHSIEAEPVDGVANTGKIKS